MTHAYSGKPPHSRMNQFSPSGVVAHLVWWAAFGFAAALVIGLIG